MASEIYLDKLYNKEGTTKVVDLTTSELTNINLTSSVGNLPSNRNLIINGDFRVNQRGAASRTENTNAYNYDRWYYDGTYLYQGVEDKSVANGAYTLSWVDAGSDITATYVVSTDSSNRNGPDSGLTYTAVSNGGNITVSEGTEYSKHLWIRFGGTLANLSKVQLVYGPVATPFELRSYGEELALCQRYYRQYNYGNGLAIASGMNYNTTNTYAPFIYPTEMRATPTFYTKNPFRVYKPGTSVPASSTSVDNSSNQSCRFVCVTSGLVAGNATWFQLHASGDYFYLDAEL